MRIKVLILVLLSMILNVSVFASNGSQYSANSFNSNYHRSWDQYKIDNQIETVVKPTFWQSVGNWFSEKISSAYSAVKTYIAERVSDIKAYFVTNPDIKADVKVTNALNNAQNIDYHDGVKIEKSNIQEKTFFEKAADIFNEVVDTVGVFFTAVKDMFIRTDENVGLEKNYDYKGSRTIKEGNAPLADTNEWEGEINVRNEYHSKLPDAALPHFARIALNKNERAHDFTLTTPSNTAALKNATSVNLLFHGYNVNVEGSRTYQAKITGAMKNENYQKPNALVSWSGNVGNNKATSTLYFNKAVQSADISWRGVDNAVSYMREQNPNMQVNAVTHSLGGRALMEAARNGVQFDNVVLLVPAIDNESLAVGGRYESAMQNIKNLVLVSSGNQIGVFGAYAFARLDRAAGAGGATGTINHPSFEYIDATKANMNKYHIEINDHSDIYEAETAKMIIEQLNKKWK